MKRTVKTTPTPVGMAQLRSNLAAIREELANTGKSDDEVDRLADRETLAIIAIGRLPAASVQDFAVKLRLLFDVEAADLATFDGCQDFRALKRGVLADIAKLFDAASDEGLIRLCREYHEVHAWIKSRNGTGACDNVHPEYEAWDRALDLRHKLFCTIARKRAKTLVGCSAQASVLPDQVQRATGLPACDRVERLVANLTASLAALVWAPPTVCVAPPTSRKAA